MTDTEPQSSSGRPGPGGTDALAVECDLVLSAADAGQRLDQVLARRLPAFSRSRIQGWIGEGKVRVDGERGRPRTLVHGGERVSVRASLEPVGRCEPEAVPIDILFEDEHLLVIDKPAGLVVHPAAGNWKGTLQNGLLYRDPGLDRLPRCGIVHRLDKDTSGLLVVARTPLAHKSLTEQLKARTLKREYRALVLGELVGDGRVEAPIGRHPTRRTSMAVVAGGRPAVTEYRVLWGYPGLTWLAVHLQTGRTHQIRVHMSHIRHPLLGDPLYGARPRLPAGLSPVVLAALRAFPRQALHAIRLGLVHPASGEAMCWQAPLAADLGALLQVLDAEQGHDHGVR